jgi:ATP phosphoribosyltransferase
MSKLPWTGYAITRYSSRQSFPGGRFINWDEDGREWNLIKDIDVAEDVASTQGSIGFVGLDKTLEYGTAEQPAEAVCVITGLRFAILSRPDLTGIVTKKLASGDRLTLGTSYPKILGMVLGETAVAGVKRAGSVEGLPWRFPDLDGIFELVST